MIGGQVVDIESEGQTPTAELVEAIHRAKTGALITTSIVSGGLLGLSRQMRGSMGLRQRRPQRQRSSTQKKAHFDALSDRSKEHHATTPTPSPASAPSAKKPASPSRSSTTSST